ncbi:hypothetical protein CKAH01_16663 [Colletotrichum kahawae]|uniref:Uncharacterized protein n=1 Tax=Colletotrichum kahawae TaxID=34407 RepID=A0AAD9YF41_COLKA|nr:hypothetical protein CKAH01_16663 [Colletotrichum kahawae]
MSERNVLSNKHGWRRADNGDTSEVLGANKHRSFDSGGSTERECKDPASHMVLPKVQQQRQHQLPEVQLQ